MYVTICMRLYLADRFLENWGVWDNMYETIYKRRKYNIIELLKKQHFQHFKSISKHFQKAVMRFKYFVSKVC